MHGRSCSPSITYSNSGEKIMKTMMFICLLALTINLHGESGCMEFYRETKLGKNPLQPVKRLCACNCQQQMKMLPSQPRGRCIFCRHFKKPLEINYKNKNNSTYKEKPSKNKKHLKKKRSE